MRVRLSAILLTAAVLLGPAAPARAQFGPGGPPAVGVVKVAVQPVIETSEFVGRVQATDKVDIVARVTAFIQERNFTEGTEVQKGDLLFRLERAPFEADLQAKQASVAQYTALLRNATITLNRAQSLLNTPAGQRSTVDDAQANQASVAAQLLSAQAQLRSSQINLDYTEIHAPVAGKIGRTAFTIGNVVSPTSGTMATIVSQDPMYVVFPVSVRAALDLRNRYAGKGGFEAVNVKLRLSDGSPYASVGRLDYVDPQVTASTDTLIIRAQMPNPIRAGAQTNETGNRELVDGMFVTVMLEGVEPIQALGIPRSAVLSDQQGSYVYIVDDQGKAQQRRIQLGQSTAETAIITAGLKAGETVIVDGIQRVRPGIAVNVGPASGGPAAPPPGGVTSGGATPRSATSGGATPGGAASGGATSGAATSGGATPASAPASK